MKKYNYNGVVYTGIERYPKFALAFSSEKRKYSLYSVEDGTATDFFLDEITTSDKPLRSWTENYVVGRIGKNYYIVDSCGNCFHESKEKYVICRNLFVCECITRRVFGDEDKFFNFAINKNLDKIDYSQSYLVVLNGYAVSKGYDFYIWHYSLMNAYGNPSQGCMMTNDFGIKNLNQNICVVKPITLDSYSYVFLDYDFKVTTDYVSNINLLSSETLTYMLIYRAEPNRYYSQIYGDLAYWIDLGDFEFILKEGDSEAVIHKKVDCKPKYLKLSIEGVYIYIIDNKAIVVQKSDGKIIENTSLSLGNIYRLAARKTKLLKNMEK